MSRSIAVAIILAAACPRVISSQLPAKTASISAFRGSLNAYTGGDEAGTVRFHVDHRPHAVAAVTLELAPEPSDGDAAT